MVTRAASFCPPHMFRLLPEFVPGTNDFVWMLSLGIEVGFPTATHRIQAVPNQGAAKVLRVVAGGTLGDGVR